MGRDDGGNDNDDYDDDESLHCCYTELRNHESDTSSHLLYSIGQRQHSGVTSIQGEGSTPLIRVCVTLGCISHRSKVLEHMEDI